MLYNNTKLQQKYHDFIQNTEKYDTKMKMLEVDFSKPWWHVLLQQKKLVFLVTFVYVIISIFDALFPLLIAWAVNSASVSAFALVVLARLFTSILVNRILRYNVILQLQTIHSVEYCANKYFLTVDPIFHSTKSSGEILSKVQRGSDSYERVMDIVTFDLLPISVTFLTTVLTMFAFDWKLGLTSAVFVVMITLVNIFGNIFNVKTFEPKANKVHDKLKGIIVENLQQANFIRSIFATPEQLEKMKKMGLKNMVTTGNSWAGSMTMGLTVRAIYMISILFIGVITMNNLQLGILNSASALAIILTYTSSTQGVLYIGDKVKRLSKSLVSITDLFELISTFGQQSYPVLEDKKTLTNNKS